MTRHRFDRQGNLALHPQAFFVMFEEPEELANESRGDVEIVSVCGPLVHHVSPWFDSYDSILSRVETACEGRASTIVLRVDSPGGDLSGCFDTSRAIRARCAAAGKRLIAHVEGQACSGGYAIACAAEKVVASDTAVVGSIGVLNVRVDVTAADAAYGVRFALTASGKRKADGHPHQKLSGEEAEATQQLISSLASVFFELVAEQRGADVDAIAGLEAGCFHGASAISAGLVDSVQSFDALLSGLSAGTDGEKTQMPTPEEEKEPEAKSVGNIDDARAALKKAAEGEGEEAERARAALKALDGTPDEEEDAAAAKSGDDTSASSSASRSVSSSTAGELGATVATLSQRVVKLEKEKEAIERREFLASRPDIGEQLLKVLADKPLAEVKSIVAAIPKPTVGNPAAGATVSSTRGEGQQSLAPGLQVNSPAASFMDRAMGLSPQVGGVRREGSALVFEAGETLHSNAPKSAPRVAGEKVEASK